MIQYSVIEEALRLYQNDWKKTKHNSFMPDMFLFKNAMSVEYTKPYMEKAENILKIKYRAEKLKKIKNKING